MATIGLLLPRFRILRLLAVAVAVLACAPAAHAFLLRRMEIARLALTEPPPPPDFDDAVRVPSPYASDGPWRSFDEVLLCTSPIPADKKYCPDFAALIPRRGSGGGGGGGGGGERIPAVVMLYPLCGMDAGTWARVKVPIYVSFPSTTLSLLHMYIVLRTSLTTRTLQLCTNIPSFRWH